ncbi:MAG: hypothetical protein DRI61_05710 [Chloroflexi bacterium]|nr:MAG: hypothetical protein DRI61_05710 [Chloroflexota bacterium]HDN81021.1 hypothetical protein [Chloroflexota bacterium]
MGTSGLNPDVIGGWVAFALTLLVFSYLIRDNPLYRLAVHLLVGVAAGYAFVVAYNTIIMRRLVGPLLEDPSQNAALLIPLLLGLLLLSKLLPRLGWFGNISMAFLFGVGAALAIGGGLLGTLWPQLKASTLSVNPARVGFLTSINNFIIVIGTVGSLLYFYFTGTKARSGIAGLGARFLKGWATLGRWMIMVALGAFFATGMIAFISLLIARLRFMLEVLGW